MKEFKGTPGPWMVGEAKNEKGYIYCDDSLGSAICNFDMKYAIALTSEVKKANGNLIAAAPDLLFSLQEITAHLDSIKQYSNDDYYINQAQLAITKALGE